MLSNLWTLNNTPKFLMLIEQKRKQARAIRAFLISRGETLNQWAKANGYCPGTVYRAVNGDRKGPKSEEILKKLSEEK